MPIPAPFYLDWQFWTVVSALIAVVLSQLPPVRLLILPRRLEVEVHSRCRVTHKVGNANVGVYVSIHNTGGRELRVLSMCLSLSRDGKRLGLLPAQNYNEIPSAQSTVLFVPFRLNPGESWAHNVNFLQLFDRATEKLYRASESALSSNIREKLAALPAGDKGPVHAAPEFVKPFTDLFNRLFIWEPGEYMVELTVEATPGSSSIIKKYRFTLFESDSADLRSHLDDYSIGGGISFDVDRHVGVFVPLSRADI